MPKLARGFTLIEALVSLTIIALVATLALPNLRRFNDDQQLKTDAEKIVSTLRLAQANAQTRIQPSSAFTGCADPSSLYWQVYFMPTQAQYSLGWLCDTAGQTNQAPVNQRIQTNTLTTGTTLQLPSGCQNFVNFNGNALNSNCFTNGSMIITLTNPKSSVSRTVTINQGGSIYAQ